MEIYQLNEYQETVLTTNSGGQKYISLVPDPEKDGEHFQAFSNHTKWNEELVREGFMVEVSTEGDKFISQMEEHYGRKYRIFMLTAMAKDMFSPVLVKGSKEGTFRNVSKTIH